MFNSLPYALVSKMAIHEARDELDRALLTFEDLLEAAARTGLTGYVGAGARLAGATMLAQLGRPEEARVQLERVDAEWSSWAGCDSQAGAGGDRGAFGRSSRGRSAMPVAGSKRRSACRRSIASGSGSVLGPVLCDAGEAGSGPAGARASARGTRRRGVDRADEGGARLRAASRRSGGRSPMTPSPPPSPRPASGAASSSAASGPGLEPVLWGALESGAVDATTAIAAIEAAFPGGPEVLGFADHPDPAVRERALLAAAASRGTPRRSPAAAGSEAATRSRRLVRSPPALAVRTLGGFEVRRGSWRLDASAWERKVAERIVRMLATRRGRVRPRGRAVRGVLARPPCGIRPPRAADRDLERSLGARPALGGDPPSRAAVAPTPWSSRSATATTLATSRRPPQRLSRRRERNDSPGWRRRPVSGRASRSPRSATPTGRPPGGSGSARSARTSSARWSSEHDGRGDHASAVRAARALVDLDPLDEHSQRLLIGAYASAGRRGDALRQFLECRRALVEELGIEPDTETLALHRRVLAG